MAEKRVYEVMYIAPPTAEDEKITELNTAIETFINEEGGEIVKTEDKGLRQLAYTINKFTEGRYVLFEVESSGSEIAELERRLRVNDLIMRYLTVRVDEERKTAAKKTAKRDKQKARISKLTEGRNMEQSDSADEADNS